MDKKKVIGVAIGTAAIITGAISIATEKTEFLKHLSSKIKVDTVACNCSPSCTAGE